jgi:hypothetical protein
MAIPFLAPVDHNQNEIRNAVIHLLATDPVSPVAGQFWYNTTSNLVKFYDGTAARTLAKLTNSIDQLAAAAAAVSLGGFQINNLATPAVATDAATKGYVDTVALGLDVHGSVVAATTVAGTLATSFANGSVIDGVTLATGNRILIKNQATPSQNGIYVVNASGAPTLASDWNSSTNALPGAFLFVEEGTVNAASNWVMTTQGTITPGTTSITWAQFSGSGSYTAGAGLTLTGSSFSVNAVSLTAGVSGILPIANGGTASSTAATALAALGGTTKYAAAIGDGSTTSIVVTHNLNSRDIHVAVYSATTPWAEVEVEVDHTSVNTITLVFSVAPSSNQFRVVVIG